MKKIIWIALSLFISCSSTAQKWTKETLPFDARIVHAIASTSDGIYLLEGRLIKGGRANDMIILPNNSEPIKKKSPDARDGHSLNSNEKEELLTFGGINSDTVLNDLWKYKNGIWKLIKPTTGKVPAPRWGHGAVYFDKKLWIFGGQSKNQSEFLQDLWSWDGKVWTQQSSVLSPESRYGCQLGVHDGKLILYGGRNHSGDWFTDTWIWENSWKKLEPKVSTAKPNASVSFALITTTSDLYLIGGFLKGNKYPEMWRFNGNKWTLITNELPFNLDFPAGCFDSTTNTMILTGAQNGNFELWKYKL